MRLIHICMWQAGLLWLNSAGFSRHWRLQAASPEPCGMGFQAGVPPSPPPASCHCLTFSLKQPPRPSLDSEATYGNTSRGIQPPLCTDDLRVGWGCLVSVFQGFSDSSFLANLLECPHFIKIAKVYRESAGISKTRTLTLALPLDSCASRHVPDAPKLQCHIYRPVSFEEGQGSSVSHSQTLCVSCPPLTSPAPRELRVGQTSPCPGHSF